MWIYKSNNDMNQNDESYQHVWNKLLLDDVSPDKDLRSAVKTPPLER